MLCFNLSALAQKIPLSLVKFSKVEFWDRQLQYYHIPHGGTLPQGKGLFHGHWPLQVNQVTTFLDRCHLCGLALLMHQRECVLMIHTGHVYCTFFI